MAKKQKKSKRTQHRKQRRQPMAQARRRLGRGPVGAPGNAKLEIAADMLAVFPDLAGGLAASGSVMEAVIRSMADSGDLAEEPEFESVFPNPVKCADTFIEVGREREHDPASLESLPDEERNMALQEIRAEAIRRLLSEDLRRDILTALDSLRLRLKQAGQPEKAGRAATLLFFLGEEGAGTLWPGIGLVQAIVQRSMEAGFGLLQASWEAVEKQEPADLATALAQLKRHPGAYQKLTTILGRTPGLTAFMEREADRVQKKGYEALFRHDLYLGLFSPEELAHGLDLYAKSLGPAGIEKARSTRARPVRLSKKHANAFFDAVNAYMASLLTPERLGHIQAKMDAALRERAPSDEWYPFLYMLVEDRETDAQNYDKRLLLSAFLGEMRVMGVSKESEEDDE